MLRTFWQQNLKELGRFWQLEIKLGVGERIIRRSSGKN
jgi:hypothetical protein